MDQRGSTLGIGWNHNYDIKLEFPDADTIIFQAAKGTPFGFLKQPDNSWLASPGVRATLTESGGQYTLKATNQTVYTFDGSGRILSQSDPKGNATLYSYDGSNRLERITDDGSQRYLELDYDSSDRLETVTDNGGRVLTFNYSNDNLLTGVIDTRAQLWQYDYTMVNTDTMVLSKVTDPDNRVVEETWFDHVGRAISQTYRGEVLSLAYHDDGSNRRTIIDGLGRTTEHKYNDSLFLEGVTDAAGISQDYTLDGNAVRDYEKDGNGNETRYESNAAGQTTLKIDAEGNRTRYDYDEQNNPKKVIDAEGRETSFIYDGNNLISSSNNEGHTTRYRYNAAGQILTKTDALSRTTAYGYDALGQRIVMTDSLGQMTRYGYDNLGRTTHITNALGQVTINQYDGVDNIVKTIRNVHPTITGQNYQNEYNLVTEYSYNGSNQKVVITDTLGRVNRTIYDETGRVYQSIQNVHPTVSITNYYIPPTGDGSGGWYNLVTTYGYNEAGEQISIIDPEGVENRTLYNERGLTQQEIINYVDGVYDANHPDEDIITAYHHDGNGQLSYTTDVLGRHRCLVYDTLNRVERVIRDCSVSKVGVIDPDSGSVTRFKYDDLGNPTEIIDPIGRITYYGYDTLNRVTVITDPLGIATHYSYDETGNPEMTTDALGRVSRTIYDELNRPTPIDPLGGRTVNTYDAAGNQTSSTNALSQTTYYGYNSLYRVISTTNAAGDTIHFTYDAAGRRLTAIDPLNQVTKYEYDSLGRMVRVIQNYAEGGPEDEETNVASSTVYDIMGRRIETRDGNDTLTQYQHDALGRVIAVVGPTGSISTTYDGLGNQSSCVIRQYRKRDPERYS